MFKPVVNVREECKKAMMASLMPGLMTSDLLNTFLLHDIARMVVPPPFCKLVFQRGQDHIVLDLNGAAPKYTVLKCPVQGDERIRADKFSIGGSDMVVSYIFEPHDFERGGRSSVAMFDVDTGEMVTGISPAAENDTVVSVCYNPINRDFAYLTSEGMVVCLDIDGHEKLRSQMQQNFGNLRFVGRGAIVISAPMSVTSVRAPSGASLVFFDNFLKDYQYEFRVFNNDLSLSKGQPVEEEACTTAVCSEVARNRPVKLPLNGGAVFCCLRGKFISKLYQPADEEGITLRAVDVPLAMRVALNSFIGIDRNDYIYTDQGIYDLATGELMAEVPDAVRAFQTYLVQ